MVLALVLLKSRINMPKPVTCCCHCLLPSWENMDLERQKGAGAHTCKLEQVPCTSEPKASSVLRPPAVFASSAAQTQAQKSHQMHTTHGLAPSCPASCTECCYMASQHLHLGSIFILPFSHNTQNSPSFRDVSFT